MSNQNLATLSAYLKALPADYAQFEMKSFLDADNDTLAVNYVLNNGSVASCGTSACAVGHGPAAHLFMNKDEAMMIRDGWSVGAWRSYVKRVFGAPMGTSKFEWMFGGGWSRVDNTVHGAAARIDHYLAHGVPEGFFSSIEDARS